MADKYVEMRKWQKEQLKRYELNAAIRMARVAAVFLLFFAAMMTLALTHLQH